MRLPFLLVVAVTVLFTHQVSAQSTYKTDCLRRLGWGSGPGYHAYSQAEILSRSAHGQHCGCTTCWPAMAQQGPVVIPHGGAGVPVTSQPMVPPQGFQMMTPPAAPQPRLAPPQRVPQIEPLPAPASAAYRFSGYQRQIVHYQPQRSLDAPIGGTPLARPRAFNPLITPTRPAAGYTSPYLRTPAGNAAGSTPHMFYRP